MVEMTINDIDMSRQRSAYPVISTLSAPSSSRPEDYGCQSIDGAPSPAPIQKPPFTLKEIRDAIPPHCFERSLLRSSFHLLLDLLFCFSVLYLSTFIHSLQQEWRVCLWPLYWIVQATSMTGLWVMGHECGHHGFSPYKKVNDTVGFFIHSFLMVPYFTWQETHRKHHMHTSSCENDETHIPPPRSSVYSWLVDKIQDHPLYNFFCIAFMVTIGWIPFYLIYNVSGPTKYNGGNASHFSLSSQLYKPNQWKLILLSDIGVFSAISVLVYLSMKYGIGNVIFHYGIPFVGLYTYFTIIVTLHHTDTYIPHYRGTEWSWLRGSLCTVDRSYGFILDHVMHQISSTHVVHHLFPSLPFYHAREATKYMSKVVGKYHLKDDTPILKALWRAVCNCHFVEDGEGIVFWKKSFNQ